MWQTDAHVVHGARITFYAGRFSVPMSQRQQRPVEDPYRFVYNNSYATWYYRSPDARRQVVGSRKIGAERANSP